MRICLHIGPDSASAVAMQRMLSARRKALAKRGVLFARAPGAQNHTRLFMAASEPGQVDALRHHRGFGPPDRQAALARDVVQALASEVAQAEPETLILSAHQLGSGLVTRSEVQRLRGLLRPLSDDIRIIAHVDDPARMLVRRYVGQVMEGRSRSLNLELGLVGTSDWWTAALGTRPRPDPATGQFAEVQGAVHWLDYARLVREWDAVFGPGATRLHSLPQPFDDTGLADLVRDSFALPKGVGLGEGAVDAGEPPAAAWLTRCRLFNDAILRLMAQEHTVVPRKLWRSFLQQMQIDGAPLQPGGLSALSDRFAADIADLRARHPGLNPAMMAPDDPLPPWQEADPTRGFRATQYLLAFEPRLKKARREAESAQGAPTPPAPPPTAAPQDTVPSTGQPSQGHLTAPVQDRLARLLTSRLAPHNRMGAVDDVATAPPYPAVPPQVLPTGSTGTVVVACMKNEAPYIVEWIAYHRAIGVDRFLIYTNGCEDGTDRILDRLQDMGIVEHRRNDDWAGKSPQQHALNRALKEDVLRRADWIIHIDVDEFINVRCGDGTLNAFRDRVPDATAVAMTWRLFGHNGVLRLRDDPVIDQFDSCAPKYCPKPHTVWGFKTMFRNDGAYGKLSCHRPNRLAPGREDRVKWVNGSGQDMTAEALHKGWRSSNRSVGYDLLQLNHYALRSADSFLIKRQRGRALHVDRSIGLNYWIRMDWSGERDITIKRNMPRLRAEIDRLMDAPALAQAHRAGIDWHRARAKALHATPEFADLYRQAVAMRLSDAERVACALTLDMES